jgi:hypothetical protein
MQFLMGVWDWLSGKQSSTARAAKQAKHIGKVVERALWTGPVRAVLDAHSLNAEALFELRERLSGSVPEWRNADAALQNVELLEWYFSRPDRQKLTLEESFQLALWVRYGEKPNS